MDRIIIYHGSPIIIEKPIYHYDKSNIHNDYGLGFYCAFNLDMAKEWANRYIKHGFANKFSFDGRGLNILDLTDKSKYSVLNWIAILLHNRELDESFKEDYEEELTFLDEVYYLKDIDKYDVIVGFRADDAYFKFPLMFIRNVLTYEKLETIYMNGNLGKQIAIMSEKAFSRLKFIKAIEAEEEYFDRYKKRKDDADNRYKELENSEKKSHKNKIRDLMRAYYEQKL